MENFVVEYDLSRMGVGVDIAIVMHILTMG